MKNRLHTGKVLGFILILLFMVSFYNFLQVRAKKEEMDQQKQDRKQMHEILAVQDAQSKQDLDNTDKNAKMDDITSDMKQDLKQENEEEKHPVVSLERITAQTTLKLVGLDASDKRNTVNVTMNSACFEMGFSEFSEYLKDHLMEVLTEKVYELNKTFDPYLDPVTILVFGSKNVVLGISCGQTGCEEINSGFDYYCIVENENLYVYQIKNELKERSIYMKCELTEYNFPVEIVMRLENGVFFKDEKELYNFLESYSS